MQITNKKILLTGASSGIGKSIAYKLAEEKCTLILIARRIELLNEIKKDLEHSGAKKLKKMQGKSILQFSRQVPDTE